MSKRKPEYQCTQCNKELTLEEADRYYNKHKAPFCSDECLEEYEIEIGEDTCPLCGTLTDCMMQADDGSPMCEGCVNDYNEELQYDDDEMEDEWGW